MARPAISRMTLAEFLRWEDGTDTRWQLIDGAPMAMAPPAVAHGMLSMRLGARIEAALRTRRPCIRQTEAGIALSDRDDTFYVADTKAADYRRIPSVEEILLIDSESIFAEVWRREGERWITEIVRGPEATLSLASIGIAVAMAELYEGIELGEPHPRRNSAG